MRTFVTLTYDLTTRRTTIELEGCQPYTATEPDGIIGLCRTGCLFSRCGSCVTYRVRRSRVDAARVDR